MQTFAVQRQLFRLSAVDVGQAQRAQRVAGAAPGAPGGGNPPERNLFKVKLSWLNAVLIEL